MGSRNDLFCSTDARAAADIFTRQKDVGGKADLIDLVSDEEEKGGHVEVASTAAIGEANVNDVDPNTRNNPSAQLLYRPSDENFLNPLRCFIRQQIEFFDATPEDVSERNSFVRHAQTRTIIVGQVGMRCIHCAHVPPKHHTKGSVCYPTKIDGIRVWGKFYEHIQTCLHIPQSVRDQHKALKFTKAAKRANKPGSASHLLQRYKENIVEKDGRLEFSRTALGPRIPNANTNRHWTCDICNLSTFTDYDDARKHEETCNDSEFANLCADADVATMVSADKSQNGNVADQSIVLPGDDDESTEDHKEEEEGPYKFQGKSYRTYSDMVNAKRARNAGVLQAIGLLDAAAALRRGAATQNASMGGKKRKFTSEEKDTPQQTRRRSSRLKKQSNVSYCDEKDAEVESSESLPRNGDSDNEEYVPNDGDSDSDDEDYKLSTCCECLQVEDRSSNTPFLLCDGNGCNAACHLTCAKDRPKLTKIPEGDWFCSSCSMKKAPANQKSRSTTSTSGTRISYPPNEVVVDCNDGDSAGDFHMYEFDAIIGHSIDANASRMQGDYMYLFDVQWVSGEITSEPDIYLMEDDSTTFAAYLRSSGLAKKEEKYAWANDEENDSMFIDV